MNLLILFLALGSLVPLFYFFQKSRFSRRHCFDRKELVTAYGVSDDDYNFLTEILSDVGKCYRIDYLKLRPKDSFEGNLKQLDSWVLDAGNEKLSDILLEKYGVDNLQNIKSVGDVVKAALAKSQKVRVKGTRL